MNDFLSFKFAGIYAIRNTVNGMVYVGQSKNIAVRIRSHKNKSSNEGLCSAIQSYGWDVFDVEVLERVDDLTCLTQREQYWIDKLQVCDPDKGYNVDQARLMKPISLEAREKMRLAKLGKKLSPEHKAAIKAGHPHVPRVKRPPTTIYLDDADHAAIAVIRRHYGVHTMAGIIRLALRLLAERIQAQEQDVGGAEADNDKQAGAG